MANLTCYTGDGSESADIPCGFPSSNQCCGSGWDCLSNGLCQQRETTAFSQGTCTNPEFDGCLSFCNKDRYEGATEVSNCGVNSWCCAGQAGLSGLPNAPDCCDSSTTTLQPYPYAIAVPSPFSSSSFASSSSNRSPTTHSTATTPISSEVQLQTGSTRTGGGSPTTGRDSPTNSPAQPATHNGGLNTAAKIGIGIGVPFGLMLLAALVFYIYKSKKQGRYLQELRSRDMPHTEDQKQTLRQDPELDDTELRELDGTTRKAPVGELHATSLAGELMVQSPRYEMEGNRFRDG
ncbi:hypothetical protein LTR37_008862 [Vermiconidia calcicola]|uniref:Uncharacterized protein n=1 Tax=Vermiconidia calcicola TaxID=1690605 RepID=A0ACC3N9X4_9PEZI|nr:hypothetical protein LTR37_008862 [Vermiconidia calcicola]